MKTINLEILTPEKIAYSDEVNMITAPSAAGQIGILPGHIPLFTRLNEGEVKITKGMEENYLAIGGGFLSIAADKAVILVTSAFRAEELNEAELLEARKRAQEALAQKPTGEALIALEAQFRRSQIGLNLLKRKRRDISSVS